jgi:hypothetical protein
MKQMMTAFATVLFINFSVLAKLFSALKKNPLQSPLLELEAT